MHRRGNYWGHSDPSHTVSNKYSLTLRSLLTPSDVTVIHGNTRLVRHFRRLKKNIFLYAHGSEVRGLFKENLDVYSSVKHIFMATPDLKGEFEFFNTTWIPNPVPIQFSPGPIKSEPRALSFHYGADKEAEDLARAYGIPLEIRDRNIPYSLMPSTLRQFTHYIDVKRDHRGVSLIKSGVLSLTALEALGSGLTVITEDGLIKGLDPKHRIEYSGPLFLKTVKDFTRY